MSRIIRNLTDTLSLLSRGKFSDKLNSELTTAIETLEALPNEKGSATITITLSLNYQSGRLDIKPAVKTKLPEGQAFSETPFWTLEGGLSVQHPSQTDMFVREAPAAPQQAATAG